jgi:hypothetical protein
MYRLTRPAGSPDFGQQRYWPFEAVAVLDWGCGMNAVVDCRSPEGTVLLVDPRLVGKRLQV